MAEALFRSDSTFDRKGFTERATREIESLELKQRSHQIYIALCEFLPSDFLVACKVIKQALHPCVDGAPMRAETDEQGIQGWLIMPLAEFVGLDGAEHLPEAMALMRELTMRFTAEFGIRHLLKVDPTTCLSLIETWISDENEHVRRLASEGTRPRLPWGLRLQAFVKEPQLTLPLLEKLRDDPSEYVRRSVANHLNDIAKDHPQLILNLAHDWHMDAPEIRQKMLRHALRNLLKEGRQQALSLYDMSSPQVRNVFMELPQTIIAVGESLTIRFQVESASAREQRLRFDIVIHYRKGNGTLSPKVFRWKDINLPAHQVHVAEKKISFRPITTRRYYGGLHKVEIKINGAKHAELDFDLSA